MSGARTVERGPPSTSRGARVGSFLAEAFPPWILVPACAVNFGAVFLGLEALARPGKLALPLAAVLPGALTVALFSLLMRVYDELKDVATDIRLGRAGDPKYRDKPIVTGHLLESDLVSLRWAVTGLLVFANAPLGPAPFAAFAAVFGALWLSSRWFFWPRISRSLLLAFVTHNPLTLAVALYMLAVEASALGPVADPTGAAALLVALWFPVAAWETARKVRAPSDETDYETYSKVLGWRTAALVPAGFVVASLALLVFAGARMGLGPVFAGAVALGAAVPVAACLRFRITGASAHAKLQPAAELYALVANGAVVVSLVATRGLEV